MRFYQESRKKPRIRGAFYYSVVVSSFSSVAGAVPSVAPSPSVGFVSLSMLPCLTDKYQYHYSSGTFIMVPQSPYFAIVLDSCALAKSKYVVPKNEGNNGIKRKVPHNKNRHLPK